MGRPRIHPPKSSKVEPAGLSRDHLAKLLEFCGILHEHYQRRSYLILNRAIMDEARRSELASRCLTRLADLDELQVAIQKVIDAMGPEDDDE